MLVSLKVAKLAVRFLFEKRKPNWKKNQLQTKDAFEKTSQFRLTTGTCINIGHLIFLLSLNSKTKIKAEFLNYRQEKVREIKTSFHVEYALKVSLK